MKTQSALLSLFILLPLIVFSQQTKTDSLLAELEAASSEAAVFDISEKLWAATVNADPDAAMQHAERIIGLGHDLQVDTILSSGLYKKGVCHAYTNNYDSSGYYFRWALALFETADDYEAIASVQRNIGQDHNMVGELDSALYYYQLSGANFARIDDSIGIADIYNSEAIVYLMKGYYNLAFDKAVAGERIFEQREELAMDLQQNRLVIATLYSEMKDTVNALPYFQKTIDFFAANNMQRQVVSNSILMVDLMIPNYEQYPEIESLIANTIKISESLQDPSLLNSARLSESYLAYYQGDYARARRIQAELVESSTKEGQEFIYYLNTLALGRTLLAEGNYPEAIRYLKETEENAIAYETDNVIRDARKLLSQAYEQTGNYRESLAYYKGYKAVNDRIFDQERTNRFSELQTIYETEKKEAELALQAEEIKTLDAEAKASRLSATLYGTGMLSFIVISGLLYFGFRQRMKKNQLERERQETILKTELAFKKKELTSQTLHLVQKSTYLQEIQENLEQIKQAAEPSKTDLNKVINSLRRQSGEDETWEVFKSYFTQVHNDFDQNLRQVAGEVTENDVRLASFLRMNLTTKEIASLLNVLPESVLKSKYRLKKKLGLAKEQDLGGYLASL